MKKVIDLFDKNYLPNHEIKYSELLEKFMEKFVHELEHFQYAEELIDFSISCWNYANLSTVIPKDDFKKFLSVIPKQDLHLTKKMINHKIAHFKDYTSFIVDFELKGDDDNPILTVISQTEEDYLANMLDAVDRNMTESDFQENYINRYAIVLKPRQPFLDWYKGLYPTEDIEDEEIKGTNIYLVSEDKADMELWLKKKFDLLFKYQLEEFSLDKKMWPQRRTYKMFKDWFQVDTSIAIYDLEKQPVLKLD